MAASSFRFVCGGSIAVLACIMSDAQSRQAQPWDYATLAQFNKAGTLEIIEAVCQRCGKHYNCEFGIVQD